jgi:hypothetical protein
VKLQYLSHVLAVARVRAEILGGNRIMEPINGPSKPEQPTQSKVEQPKPEHPVLSHPTTQNAIKLVGESFLPGASLLMDGKILHGGVHLLAGAVAKAFLGPIGIAAVIGNSYSTATTGKNLLEHFSRLMPPKTE